MATAATKVGPKFQVTIPKNVRDAVGLKVGDLVEASVGRAGIVSSPEGSQRQASESGKAA